MFGSKNNNSKNFLSFDKYIGTFEYWKEKYGDKFDDWSYEIMEILSKEEDKDVQKQKIEEVYERRNRYNEYLLKEFESRQNSEAFNSLKD